MRILVPLDFNAPSRHACDWAIQQAKRSDPSKPTELFYLHVLEPMSESTLLREKLDKLKELEDEVDSMRELAESEMKRTLGSSGLPPNVSVRYVVARGKPDLAIVGKAQELGAELIVMGTHGRTGFDRLYLGSVTEKVVRSAPCTVVVVKARASDFERERAGETP